MRLSSTGFAVVVAAYYTSCIARSTAAPTPAIVSGELQSALHSPDEILHDDKRFLRAPIAAGHEDEDEGEDRGLLSWLTPRLAAGAETLSEEKLQKLVKKVVKDPEFYNDLVMADRNTQLVTYATWQGLGIKPKQLTKSMEKAGYGGNDYIRIANDYAAFLKSDIRIQ